MDMRKEKYIHDIYDLAKQYEYEDDITIDVETHSAQGYDEITVTFIPDVRYFIVTPRSAYYHDTTMNVASLAVINRRQKIEYFAYDVFKLVKRLYDEVI